VSYKVLKEEPDHWVAQDEKGQFKVAKKGLSPRLQEKIASMAKGGEVLKAAEGTEVYDPTMDPIPPSAAMAETPAAGYDPNAPWGGRQISLADIAGAGPAASVVPSLGSPAVAAGVGAAREGGMYPVSPVAAATDIATGKTPLVVPALPPPGAGSAGPAVAPAATQAAAPAPAPKSPDTFSVPRIPGGGGGGATKGANEAANEGAQAIRTAGSAQAAFDAQMAQAQQAANDYQNRIFARASAMRDSWNTRMEAAYNGVANGSIDPNQYWHNKNTGQLIGTSIAMGLGAMGSSMTGTPNYVAESVNNAIARDIDAQKANLGLKRSLLSDAIQAGHSIDDATQLAMAHGQAVATGMLKNAAYKYGSPVDQANANAEAEKYLMSAKSATSEIALRSAQAAEANAQTRMLNWQAGMIGPRFSIQDKIDNGQDLTREEALFSGRPIRRNPATGGYRAFTSPEEASQFDTLDQGINDVVSELQKLPEPGLKNPLGQEAILGNEARDRAAGKLLALGKSRGGPLNDQKIEFYKNQIGSINTLRPELQKAKTQELIQSLARERMIALMAHTGGRPQ